MYHEHRYKILKKDLRKARLFTNTPSFTVNLWVINNHLEFNRNFKNIYLSELQLKKEEILTSEASGLDFYIIVENKKFKTQPYDKRDVFFFSTIVRMPHLDSKIPSNIYYESIGSETLRFVRNTSDVNTFVTLSNLILKRTQK